MFDLLLHILLSTWAVILASAPWLLFGFFIAGIVHVLLPADLLQKQFRAPGFFSVIKASAFGVPLPLCSCSVIPVGVSLRRAGASRGATASFMVSTPEIGIDSFLLSYRLLGPLIAVMRLIAAFCSAILAGVLIDRMPENDDSAKGDPQPTSVASQPSLCCAKNSEEKIHKRTFGANMREIFHFAFIEIVDDLAAVLIMGFLLAGIISAVLPPNFVGELHLSSLAMMFVMLFVSLPLYVCAASSTPIAAALVAKGLSAGAAIVFLLAGPASNITTILAIRKELGTRALMIYLTSIAFVALLIGGLFDAVIPGGSQISSFAYGEDPIHVHGASFFDISIGLLLSFLLGAAIVRRNSRRLALGTVEPSQDSLGKSCCHHK